MTVRLLLMRHAKSSWKSDAQSDHERPLNERGRRDAPRMAELLMSRGWVPSHAFVSDASRTEETWAWMNDRFDTDVPTTMVSRLYHGDLDDIVSTLTPPPVEPVILVLGHNPGWEEAVARLSGDIVQMRTANIAVLEHEGPWIDALGSTDWTLVEQLTPKVHD